MKKGCVVLVFAILSSVVFVNSALADMDELRSLFLQGNYHQTIIEGKVILMDRPSADISCETYYYMGIAYMKQAFYDEAKEYLTIAKDKYPGCRFSEKAHVSFGDVYLLEGQLEKALSVYQDAFASGKESDGASLIYFRLGQVNRKLGNWKEGNNFLKELKEKFPESPLVSEVDRLLAQDDFFTVQVGAFIHADSAKKLVKSLKGKGFDAYMKKARTSGGILHRVRVGRLSTRKEAVVLELQMAQDGHPTLIVP